MLNSLYATLFTTLVIFLLVPTSKLRPIAKCVLLFALFGISQIPLQGVSLTMALRGLSGDLSIVSTCWLAFATAARFRSPPAPLPWRYTSSAAIVVLLAALYLYPATLGLTAWDPYRAGYGLPLAFACTALVFVLTLLKQYFAATALSLALLAYALRLLESENLWDYVIDPWLSLYALFHLLRFRRRKML